MRHRLWASEFFIDLIGIVARNPGGPEIFHKALLFSLLSKRDSGAQLRYFALRQTPLEAWENDYIFVTVLLILN